MHSILAKPRRFPKDYPDPSRGCARISLVDPPGFGGTIGLDHGSGHGTS